MNNRPHQSRSRMYRRNSCLFWVLSIFCLSSCSKIANLGSSTTTATTTTNVGAEKSTGKGSTTSQTNLMSLDDPRMAKAVGTMGSIFTFESQYTDKLTELLAILEKSNQNAGGHVEAASPSVGTASNKSTVNSNVVAQSLAMGLCNFANLYSAQGKYADAIPLYQRALTVLEQAVGPKHVALLTVLDDYATALEKTGQPDKAAQLKTRATNIRAENARKNGIQLPNRK